jgi:group II intron reverse transcriptase/maturase
MLKQEKLRHLEYYDLQEKLDKLYAQSKEGKPFRNLMEIIRSDENIKLAYRNIKRNHGSTTKGTDRYTIRDIEKLSEREYVEIVKRKLDWYKPKPVRRVEIPKPNGKKRPLGIPTIVDRLVQQCILQVLEPICEARFYEHSYGFRPNRSVENAIAQCVFCINMRRLSFVVDIDIKGFFDNVNHNKLVRQMWAMGIRDKKLICIIKEMLKAPIIMPDGKMVKPDKGTPQGGILSPLLANIVLNELDWWVASQWEELPTRYPYKMQKDKKGNANCRAVKYRQLKAHSNLKEMYIVRYADDFKIFCRKRSDANKIFVATRQWLSERLKLEVSEEKSKVINLKRSNSEYLGFRMKAVRKRNKWVTRSHVAKKAIAQENAKLKAQFHKIVKSGNEEERRLEIMRYNSIVWGAHNYYNLASCVAADFAKTQHEINGITRRKFGKQAKQPCAIESMMIRNKYGKSGQMRFISGMSVCPIGYVTNVTAMVKKKEVCKYTPKGRELIHANLKVDTRVLNRLSAARDIHRSIEFMDNRISLYVAQYGKCAVTGWQLWTDEIYCHHKLPASMGGDDKYQNLIIVHPFVHKLIHASEEDTIREMLEALGLEKKQVEKVNKLRETAGKPAI